METEITHPASAPENTDESAAPQSTATLVQARLPTDAFALEDTLTAVSDLSVACASLVTAGQTGPLPLLWFHTDDSATLTAALADDPTVTTAEPLVHSDERHLYRMEWAHNLDWLCHVLLNSQAILLDASASERHWTVEILYPDREALQTTSEFCEQYDLSLTIESIRTLDPAQPVPCGLTADQYEAMTVASQMGYFTVPREATLEAVATEIGVSHQALSERLRRGHETIISAVLGGAGPALANGPFDEGSLVSQQ